MSVMWVINKCSRLQVASCLSCLLEGQPLSEEPPFCCGTPSAYGTPCFKLPLRGHSKQGSQS